ncbi:glycosyltransferase family 39 protein [Leptolyngbya sp. FACHB-17]|uniref:ArnT family glycosyltransferase n=1 Tax=unclassified Leptolyngbya TaxID=2650499 RepID=UPI001681045F|nr:glycosyltransferase family 39 protein [Leptolyngbya sp. FACHB-17]MBD2082946.1 glycosyltransferase family 39 protein [Leptolyngbya sp. FACHB-17]
MLQKLLSKPNSSYPLITILFTAAAIRLYRIDLPFISPASWRETDTATIADNFYRWNWNIFYPAISWNGSEPSFVGYEFQTVTYISAQLYRIFGQHDWVARVVAISFGLLSIFALYQLVYRAWDQKHAIISATILAIFPGSIYVDRAFLPDPVMVSLMVTSFWLLVAFLQTERIRYLIITSLVAMLGILTKITGIFLGIPILYAVITILRRKRPFPIKQASYIGIAAVIALIPVVAYYLWAGYVSRTYPPYHIAAAGNFVWNDGLNQWLEKGYYIRRLYGSLKEFWTYPLMALVAVGVFLRPPGSSEASNSNKLPWVFHWWIFAIALYYLIGAKQLIDNPHNLNILHPAAAALVARALVVTTAAIHRAVGIKGSIAFLLITFLIVAGNSYYSLKYWTGSNSSNYLREGYELGLALRKVTQPNDLVVTVGPQIGNPIAIYYSQRKGWTFPPAWKGVVWWAEDDLNDGRKSVSLLKELESKGAKYLGVVHFQKEKIWKNNPELAGYIDRTFPQVQTSESYAIYRIASDK